MILCAASILILHTLQSLFLQLPLPNQNHPRLGITSSESFLSAEVAHVIELIECIIYLHSMLDTKAVVYYQRVDED